MSAAATAVFTTLFALSTVAPAMAGDSGPDCVRRGEYANALSSLHELDPATRTAYLIMAGDLAGAAGQVDSETDGLLNTFLRFGLEDWPGVLEVSGRSCRNRWLDIFRLHMRAAAFSEMSMPDSVIAVTGRALTPTGPESPAPVEHQLYDRLVDLRFGAFIDSGDKRYGEEMTPDMTGRLSPLTLLRIASDLMEKGERGASVDMILGMRTGGLEEAERGILDQLLGMLLSGSDRIEGPVLAELCRSAMRAGLDNTASRILERLADSGEVRWETAYLRGRLLESEDKFRLARRKYLEIFQSEAPVHLKKESLLRIASIDYRIRHLDRSAQNLRLFGVYYPDDRRTESVLDRAARIQIARGRPDMAIETWEILGKTRPATRQGRAGLISKAVTEISLGRRDRARRTLAKLLADGNSLLKDAASYWMYRACDDPDSASVYLESLKREYPLSIYTYSAGREKEALLA
ncbi:MAG TPA: hypothetical protein VLA34_06950, partial [Candidatus Krumholzibacterium sp.]|nr:hypothetical protein [Candidatus Krumholzibacterium sp.]